MASTGASGRPSLAPRAAGNAKPSPPRSSGVRKVRGQARFPRVRLDAESDRIVAADVAALDVDLQDRRVRPEVAIVEVRGELGEPRAQGEHQIGPPAGGRRLRSPGAAQWSDVERVRVGDGVVASVGGDHRDRVLLAEADHRLIRAGPRDAATDQQQRPLRLPEEPHRLANGVRVWRLRVSDPVIPGPDR
jgi:hypothetical protein